MLVLLSPAKSLDFESQCPIDVTTAPVFNERADYLIGKLQKLSKKKIQELMKLSDNLSELNYQRYKEWNSQLNLDNRKQAAYAFKGEVYRGMNVATFNKDDVNYAQQHVRILSGLYGLLKPMDAIQPYRLEMGTRLKVTPKTTNLYKYWDKAITEQINAEMAETNSDLLVNLASNEYYKAVKPDLLNGKVVSCTFKENKNGEYKILMTYAKLARGMMAAHIVKSRATSVDDLKTFNQEGYGYSESMSTETELVFIR
ncbi:MAG: peroxide stress protein YaaA [Saprospiraceae bacterium]|nr:peroxide stress protein YaaA [Saprospiraceae bacterium]